MDDTGLKLRAVLPDLLTKPLSQQSCCPDAACVDVVQTKEGLHNVGQALSLDAWLQTSLAVGARPAGQVVLGRGERLDAEVALKVVGQSNSEENFV